MHNAVKLTSVIYITAFILMLGNIGIGFSKSQYTQLSPINDGFSVFALANEYRPTKDYKVYGFLPYWKLNKTEYIQLDKLTDIAYFALNINADGTIRKYSDDGTLDPGYNQWVNNKELDALIANAKLHDVNFALTVISHDDDISDSFLDCETCWETATEEIIAELETKNITDINLDFEYVGYPEPDKTEKYTRFVALINNALDSKFGNASVTVSTFADSSIKPRITNPEELALVTDQLFVMAYDFHYPNSDRAGPVAPINRDPAFTSYDINTMLRDYLKTIPPNKLILGVPYYGYNWIVEEPTAFAVRMPGNDYIGYTISETYEGLMDRILETQPNVQWDTVAKVPYFTYISESTGHYRVVYFENTDSLKAKYELAKTYQLGGVGIWALGYDGGYQELWNLLQNEFSMKPHQVSLK